MTLGRQGRLRDAFATMRCSGVKLLMNEFRITPQVLINVVIAASLVLLFSSAPFGFLTTIGGIALLLILFSYDQGARRSVFQSLAFSAVCGLSVVLAAGIGLQRMAARKDLDVWFAGVWLCATVVAMAIDRARMSARAAIGVAPEVFAPARGRQLTRRQQPVTASV